ncbi:hypothetical protein Pint_00853 [Pistacia integerrima]|uniref:Uncharacterized protein n=1 Tax=Pistacia integerrima TaxID=434235 RepID=A0ACC0ZKC5_9ROSI|nr:hypothetical protein Pint_00853 [Pistacia integerrima]
MGALSFYVLEKYCSVFSFPLDSGSLHGGWNLDFRVELSLYVEARLAPTSASTPTPSPSPSPAPCKGQVPPVVQGICEETEFPDACINTIVPLSGPDNNTDPLSVLQLGMKALTTETQKAIRVTKKLFS